MQTDKFEDEHIFAQLASSVYVASGLVAKIFWYSSSTSFAVPYRHIIIMKDPNVLVFVPFDFFVSVKSNTGFQPNCCLIHSLSGQVSTYSAVELMV